MEIVCDSEFPMDYDSFCFNNIIALEASELILKHGKQVCYLLLLSFIICGYEYACHQVGIWSQKI